MEQAASRPAPMLYSQSGQICFTARYRYWLDWYVVSR